MRKQGVFVSCYTYCMEKKPPYEHDLFEIEQQKSELDKLVEELGFIETDELKLIRSQLMDAVESEDEEKMRALLLEYRIIAEGNISELPASVTYMHSQIALIIMMALVKRDMGDIRGCLTEIGDAYEYAAWEDMGDIVSILERAPSDMIAQLLALIGEEYGFDDETLNEIASKPYEEAFELAYGYLTQAGLDADEVLAPFINNADGQSEGAE